MIAVDSNVLLRYLLQDDAAHARQARELIVGAFRDGTGVWLSSIVLCESVWVLESVYKLNRKTILSTLHHISESDFTLAEHGQVNEAIHRYERGPADFSDYLIGQLASKAGAQTTYTFDNGLRKDTAFTQLK